MKFWKDFENYFSFYNPRKGSQKVSKIRNYPIFKKILPIGPKKKILFSKVPGLARDLTVQNPH